MPKLTTLCRSISMGSISMEMVKGFSLQTYMPLELKIVKFMMVNGNIKS